MQQDPEDETLPTVLVYRGGELETTWIRFDGELEGGLEGRNARQEVERVLLEYVPHLTASTLQSLILTASLSLILAGRERLSANLKAESRHEHGERSRTAMKTTTTTNDLSLLTKRCCLCIPYLLPIIANLAIIPNLPTYHLLSA